jgi:hypothetical protein
MGGRISLWWVVDNSVHSMDTGLLECEGSLYTDKCSKQIILQQTQDVLPLIFYKQENSYITILRY